MKLKLVILVLLNFLIFNHSFSEEMFNLGKEIFLNSGNCATCHSLKDAGSVANVGPNLNEIRPDIGRVIIWFRQDCQVIFGELGDGIDITIVEPGL